MKDTDCQTDEKSMTTLKKRETPEQQEYWEFIEKTAQHSRQRRPSWALKIEHEDDHASAAPAAPDDNADRPSIRCD